MVLNMHFRVENKIEDNAAMKNSTENKVSSGIPTLFCI